MAVLVVGNEQNFGALRERLFTGRVSAATAKRAEAAIEAANPGVDLGLLVPGTVLTIPDIPEIPDRGPLSLGSSVDAGVDAIATELEGQLAALREDSERAEREARAENRRTLAALDDEIVRRAADGDQILAAALEDARTAVEQDEKTAGERRAALAQAIDAWSAELEALRKLTS